MKPDLRKYVQKKQYSTPKTDKKERDFAQGESVIVRDYRDNNVAWQPAQIIEQTGPVSYRVRAEGSEWRRHSDQIRPHNHQSEINTDNNVTPVIPASPINTDNDLTQTAQQAPPPIPSPRRSLRSRKAVERYGQSIPID